MNCVNCNGQMLRETSPFRIDREEVHVQFDKVPAWVCPACGEVLFEETEVNAIQEVVAAVDAQSHKFAKSV